MSRRRTTGARPHYTGPRSSATMDLMAHNANINAKDGKGMTPLDSAMGRAGARGRGGTSIEVHEATAALIKQYQADAPVARQL
jgi:hypothetical protein